ncbi:MAG: hypothetical protein IIA05_06015 [Proteobacteria bacterium]|nr:hypothetical protein [Pseudomonadota bacterium]
MNNWKNRRPIQQTFLSVIVSIKDGMEGKLQEALYKLRHDWYSSAGNTKPDSPFKAVKNVHFARLVIIDVKRSDMSVFRPQLLFETWYDEIGQDHLLDLLPPETGNQEANAEDSHSEEDDPARFRKLHEMFNSVFGFCENYEIANLPLDDSDRENLRKFMSKHRGRDYANAPFVGARGRTVKQIKYEKELRQNISDHLTGKKWQERDPVAVWKEIKKGFKPEDEPPPQLPWLTRLITDAGLSGFLVTYVGFLLGLPLIAFFVYAAVPALAALLGVSAAWSWTGAFDPGWALLAVFGPLLYLVVVLNWHEINDEYDELTQPDPVKFVKNEEHILQNPMSSAILVKSGLFRLVSLELVLWFVRWVARFSDTKGQLGGISSIHFARWAIFGRPPVLLFMSNYNSSWENYLSEFVENAAAGLTLIWTHAHAFPRTRWLITKGAKDEQAFKAYSRNSMIETHLWYSAYPYLSIIEINRNSRIRQALHRKKMTADEAKNWLRLFGGTTEAL